MKEKRGARARLINRLGLAGLGVVVDFWRRHRILLLVLSVTTVLGAAIGAAFPYTLRLVIDGVKQEVTGEKLRVFILILVGIGLVRAVAEAVLPLIRGRTNELFAWEVRSGIFREVLNRGYRFAIRFPAGDVMQRLDHDMMELSWFACSGVFRFLAAALLVLFTIVMMLRMNVVLTLVTAGPAVLLVFGWMRMGPRIYTYFMRWREKIAEINNQLQTAFGGIRLVKAFVMEERLAGRFRRALSERVRVAVQEARLESMAQVFYMMIAEVAVLAVLWAGGIFVIRQGITLGEFVAFNAYLLMLIGPMFDIGNLFVAGRRAAGAGERIGGLVAAEPEVSAVGVKTPEPGELRLERVRFGYDGQEVLKGVTMVFPPGKKVGIAGTVGSGKSTVLRVLLRLVEPKAGRVLLNGIDIREFDIRGYRRLFGYAPQEPMLFSDTLRNNVLFGRKVDEAELWRVIDMAQLRQDVAELPGGLDEMLGERGSGLSGGQRARVAIARALVGMPPVLLFDDVTSALDADTEREFIQALFSAVADRSLIVVSHRLAVLSACDWIYVLDRGEVKESGTHEELLRREGLYWQLYQRQLLKEELEQL